MGACQVNAPRALRLPPAAGPVCSSAASGSAAAAAAAPPAAADEAAPPGASPTGRSHCVVSCSERGASLSRSTAAWRCITAYRRHVPEEIFARGIVKHSLSRSMAVD